ncbi:MAG: diacylglycerol kinase family protein [Acidobacteriota bacterium]
MKKKTLIIVNPAAGRGKALKALPAIEAGCRDMGLSYDVVRTEGPDDATRLAQEGANASYDVVACVGGDGTVSETGRGLIGTESSLALLPAGTGNDFARALGVYRKMDLAIRTLRDGVVKPIDVGRFGPHTFLNTVGVGFDGQVTADNQKVKTLTGILSYLVVVLKNLPTYKNPHFKLKGRDWEFQSKGVLVEFGNGQCAGGGFFLTPHADLHDGLMDVTLLGDYGPMERFVALPMVLLRRMEMLSGVKTFKTDILEISVDRPTYIHVDGNLKTLTEPATVEILPLALKVMFPPAA